MLFSSYLGVLGVLAFAFEWQLQWARMRDVDIDAIDRPPARPDRVAYSMRALGKSGLPREFTLNGTIYRLLRTVKHDFFAATAFYRDDATGRTVVLKAGRTGDFAGVPLLWLGRWLCRRELRFYTRLADVPNVPAVLGTVGPTGFVHDFVPGRPLEKHMPVPDTFFDELTRLLRELHRRGLAYGDTNKPQNILLGDDGRPHLIDFQISYDERDFDRPGLRTLNRWLLRRVQREDFYHVLKHKRRIRPDQMTAEETETATRQSALIRLHRFLFKPYFAIRRRTFKRLRETGRLMPEGSK
jgi:hypothetical protein